MQVFIHEIYKKNRKPFSSIHSAPKLTYKTSSEYTKHAKGQPKNVKL